MIKNQSIRVGTPSNGIGNRIRKILNDMPTDVWGIERNILSSGKEYLGRQASVKSVPLQELNIQLFLTGNDLSLVLCQQERMLNKLKPTDFAELMGMSGLSPKLVEDRLKEYLQALAVRENMPLENFKIKISTLQEILKFTLYGQSKMVRLIELSEILKYFGL